MDNQARDKAAEVIGRMVMKVMDISGKDTLELPADFDWLDLQDWIALRQAQAILLEDSESLNHEQSIRRH